MSKPHLRLHCRMSGGRLLWLVKWGEGFTTSYYQTSGAAIRAARLYFI